MNDEAELGRPSRSSRGRSSRPCAAVIVAAAWMTLAAAAGAQLGPACTASLLNRSVQVNEDGSFFLADVPAEVGLHRVRVNCTPVGAPLGQGQCALIGSPCSLVNQAVNGSGKNRQDRPSVRLLASVLKIPQADRLVPLAEALGCSTGWRRS